MSSDSAYGGGRSLNAQTGETIEYLLFDSLVHHLIEKGLLTKNDALSVVQTAAQVVRGKIHQTSGSMPTDAALSTLERTYASFEAVADPRGDTALHADNVLPLRPPLHGDRPRFHSDD